MTDAPSCPNCGSELSGHSPEGLCPRCLLEAGMASVGTVASHAPTLGSGFLTGSGQGVLDTIGATLCGSVPRVLLRDTGLGEDPSPVVKPSSREMPGTPGRLQLFGEIARGGMGAVLKGRDPDLGRELAVKVLLEGHRSNPDLVRRFVEEAQIAGQLQHPGVVPVYEMGQFADARPYFSMKLVKGHTLAEALDGRPDPADGLSGHIATWLQICQTVAYAHARGVIHRDLKPSNVMLGSFGEVQVMDWGLAKVLSRGGIVDDATAGKPSSGETVIATARSGEPDDGLSRFGSILGTPSYMAPEQARGETDVIDERADVFALGSILCEILTAKPAFTGRTSAEIQRKATRGDTAEALARLNNCGADAELIALAKSCLMTKEDDRPRDASVVAARGLAYSAGVEAKLRRAELERVEERSRRRLTTLAAAATILLMLVSGGGYTWNQGQKAARVAKTARAVDEALADAARLRGEAQAAPPGAAAPWAEAVSAAKRAEGLLAQGEADSALRDRVATLLTQLDREQAAAAAKARQVEADRALLAALDAIRGNHGEHLDPKRTDADYAVAFRAAGLDLDATEPAEAGRWLADRSQPVDLAGHLDEWAYVRRLSRRPETDWRRLVAAARAADPDPWRDAIRAQFGSRDAAAIAEFRRKADDEASLAAQPAPSLVLLARQLKNGAADRELAARVLRRAVFRYPGDFWARTELAIVHGASGGAARAMFPQPEESVRQLTAAVAIRPKSSSAHMKLGTALSALGKRDEATAEFREAVRLQPDNALARNSLGVDLQFQGKLGEAVAEYREAIRLEPDYLYAHGNLVTVLRAQGKLDEAVALYREAIRLKPDDPASHTNLGVALKDQGKTDEAIAQYREAIRLQPGHAVAYDHLGWALKDQGKLDEAVAAYREAIRLQPDNHYGHAHLGNALKNQGKLDEAVAEHRTAVRLRPDQAWVRDGLTAALREQGKLDEAVAEYREVIRLKLDDPRTHTNLGAALYGLGKLDEAVAAHREAIRLQPDSAWAHDWLGFALAAQGKRDEAVDEYREAIRLQPDYMTARNNLSNALKDQGKLDEAIATNRETVRLRPDSATAHHNLGITLRAQGKLDEAIVEYREAIRLQPDDANAHANLGVALKEQGKLDEAVAEYREAIRLKPDDAVARYYFGVLLEARGKYELAEAELREAVRLDGNHLGQAIFSLGNLYEKLDRRGEAIAVFREAIRIDPKSKRAYTRLLNAPRPEGDPDGDLAEYRRIRDAIRDDPALLAIADSRISDTERGKVLAERSLALLKGEVIPKDADERLALAQMCYDRGLHVAAARHWAEALEADPKLGDDRQVYHRYNAACSAALAGVGKTKDDPHPEDAARVKLREQALGWLKAERDAWAKVLDGTDPKARGGVAKTLRHWKVDSDLASVRNADAIAKLPEAEAKEWLLLWADVDALIKRAETPPR